MATGSGSGDDPAAGQAWPAHLERRRWPREPAMEKERLQDVAPALVPLRFSTRDLPAKDQFQAWRAHMAPLVDVHLPDGKSPDDGFLAEQIGWHLGSVLIVQQHTQAHSYIRDQSMLRSSPIDHWNVGSASQRPDLDRGQPSRYGNRCRRGIFQISQLSLSRADDRLRRRARLPAL